MKKTYGIVLIGCGHIGESHIEDIYYRDGIRIVGVVDLVEEQAQAFARKYGALSYGTDYRPYLTREDVDIVIIATYASSHFAILKDCLAAGKHVLCEKPMTAANFHDAHRFYELVKASGPKVLIAHVLRHNQTYHHAAKLIQEGAIGDIRLIRMAQNHHTLEPKRYQSLLHDCPPIVDCGVHYIDVIRWFTGLSITSIAGVGTAIHTKPPIYDHGILTMTLSNGASAYYEAGWSKSMASENLKEFIGTRGRIRITLKENRLFDREEGDLLEYYCAEEGVYHTINIPSKYKNMWAQLLTLIEMVETDREGSPTLDEAYEAFCIALLGDRAIRENRTISVPSSLADFSTVLS